MPEDGTSGGLGRHVKPGQLCTPPPAAAPGRAPAQHLPAVSRWCQGAGAQRGTPAPPRSPAAPASSFQVRIKTLVSDESTGQMIFRNLKRLGFVYAFNPSDRFCFPLPKLLLLSRWLQLPRGGGCLRQATAKHLQKGARRAERILHGSVRQTSSSVLTNKRSG